MKLRVAVISGGRSGEHEVSVRSAQSVVAALDRERYEVSEIFISQEGKWSPRPIVPEPGANPGIDVVLPVLHGTFGEDGTMQGLFELADLPYVSAGVLASAAAMDKEVMKRLCKERGLPIVEYQVVGREGVELDDLCARFAFPVFVKPANLGSSVGISKAHHRAELATALEVAARYDSKVLVERGIEGREFECSVMGNRDPRAAAPCEILPSREFYDYEDKYLLDKARTVLPARLSAEQTEHMRWLAVQCYRAVDCEVMARVDFLLERATGQIFINEINTVPGFTSISMFPKMWEYCGVPFPALLDTLIALAQERAEVRRALRFKR